MGRRALFVAVCGVLCALSAGAAVAYGDGGNSAAAHACQKGGYVNLSRSDGSAFKNAGECASYFAQQQQGAACAVTATTGCLTFDNVSLPDSSGDTIIVNAAFSFDSSCNLADPSNTCSSSVPNAYASGGGTYTIEDSTGAVIESGTLTAADTAGSHEGLYFAEYTASDGFTATSCSAAAVRNVEVVASSGSTPNVLLGGLTLSYDPTQDTAEVRTLAGTFQDVAPSGFSISC